MSHGSAYSVLSYIYVLLSDIGVAIVFVLDLRTSL